MLNLRETRGTGGKGVTGEMDEGSRLLELQVTLFPPVPPVSLLR